MSEPKLEPGKWAEYYDPDRPPFFRRRWRCGDCGMDNTYGKTPYCMWCGKRKIDVEEEKA
ncbi:MAG: hypothetical protein II572_07070 [Clostridia bacterium]|nr:hypothetical protein [Clostridia bacterium]